MNEYPTSFDQFIQTHDKPVLADFWAQWCGPCKMMAPILKSLAHDWKDRITVIKVNTEEKQHLAQRFNITAIPTMILFQNGVEKHRISGAMPLAQLKNELSGFL
jgi:thioredoxin 1/thioredoxin 2